MGEKTVAEELVTILKAEGVSFLSCYPTTPLIDAAAGQWLRPVLCRQERVGVGIADGYSRVTGGRSPGAFAMQWGPGVENAYSGIATAFADSSPVLLLPLGYSDDRTSHPRFHPAERLRPIAKSVERLSEPRRLHDVMRRAFSRLRNGRPGPVVVEVPHNLVSRTVGTSDKPYAPSTSSRPAGDPDSVEQAARLLRRAERPILLAGQGVLYAEATGELVRLAELLDAPVATTLEGKSAFPEDHPLSLGTGGLSMPGPLADAMAEADVVLAVGASLTRHLTAIAPPRAKTVIHVTVDEADLNRDCRTDCPIIGDARLVLGQLYEELGGEPMDRGTRQSLAGRRRDWLAEWRPRLTSDAMPIDPYRVVAALGSVLDPARSIVTHDSGSPRDQMTPFYRATVPGGYLGWGKSHALGSGLGLIMGAKIAEPDKVCVNVMGDAAFGMVGLDFETAVRNRIPILTVVLNNNTMAIETDTLAVAHDRFGSRDIGGNYADLARAMGGWAARVDDPRKVETALGEAVRATEEGSAALLEIITSPVQTPFSHRGGRH